ncbi:type II secretion system F family protein [Schlesneria paludicola]|uniref:type II secretion system F family protein n=1 Tax=Schlesneria paludicola TaxID=360056 RepID=UPI00029A6F00|nr:type II secretion system F family protein [Schlesneria paludicola]
MFSSQSLAVFYAICGVIVVWMLFRMWRKNRRGSSVENQANGLQRTNVAELKAVPVTVPMAAAIAPPPITYAASTASIAASKVSTPVRNGESSYGNDRRLLETRGMLARNENPMPRVLPEEVPGVDDSDRAFGTWLNPAFASLLPESPERKEEARRDLQSAGFYNPHAIENLAATRYVGMVVSVIVILAMLLVAPPQLEPWLMACLVLAPALAWALPALYVRTKAKERKHEIERAMPDLLDMLNMCVGQGLTVPDSLQRIGRDFRAVYPALSQELGIVNAQAKISTLQTALENFSRRIDLPEVHSLTSLLIQTERMGTSISQALTTYSDTMRESQRQQADEKGNRATFRLLFPTVLCLMPAVYLFLLGPAINELQRFFYGGGLDSLNSGSQVVQRMNATRNRGQNPGSGQRTSAGQ